MPKKFVCGVGLNDADYQISDNSSGKLQLCPFYRKWKDMLKRCYSESFKKKFPTYIGCYVCDEWLTFSNFKRWMERQDWVGKELDKDILVVGNKIYSPDTCAFVDRITNTFTLERAASKGDYPIGVCWSKQISRFVANCGDPFTKKNTYIGCFSSPEDAHNAWKRRKHELACMLADLQDDEMVANALRKRYL